MGDIFVSYASEDRERVRPLVAALESQGLSVWWDQRIQAGARWDESIGQALRDARCVVAVFSHRSVDAHWVREEAHHGLKTAKLLPVLLDEVELPIGFRTLQCIQLAGVAQGASAKIFADAVRVYFGARVGQEPRLKAPAATDRPSILLLPFTNLSDSQDTSFFVAGVHEDLLAMLSRIDGMAVISRTTSLAIAQSGKTVPQMAKDVGVSHVLEGSVRRAGDRIRMTVQLIAGATDEHVWSQNYDRNLTDIFSVQDELASSIATQLRVRLDPALLAGFAKARTKSIEAYDCVLRAAEAFRLGGAEAAPARIEHLERAIELDPNYADAFGLLAMAYAHLRRASPSTTWDDVRPKVQRYAQRALELDRHVPSGLVAMAWKVSMDEGNWLSEVGVPYLVEGLKADPGNVMLHELYANRARDYRERASHWAEAFRLDPLAATTYITHYIDMLSDEGRGAETLAMALPVREAAPDNPFAEQALALAYFARVDNISGLRQLNRAVTLSRANPAQVAELLNYLATAGCGDLISRWLAAIEHSGIDRGANMFQGWQLLWGKHVDGLAALLGRWESEAPRSALLPYYYAHLYALQADAAHAAGNNSAQADNLRRSITAFETLFSMKSVLPGRYGRIGTLRMVSFDWVVAMLRYLVVARQAADADLEARLAARLTELFSEEVAPMAMPLERALFSCFSDDDTATLALFERAMCPGSWSLPVLSIVGVLSDDEGVFHRIAAHPRFQDLVRQEQSRLVDLESRIARELPDLLDPEAILSAARSRP